MRASRPGVGSAVATAREWMRSVRSVEIAGEGCLCRGRSCSAGSGRGRAKESRSIRNAGRVESVRWRSGRPGPDAVGARAGDGRQPETRVSVWYGEWTGRSVHEELARVGGDDLEVAGCNQEHGSGAYL